MVKGHQKVELKADKRDVTGRKVKHLRAAGIVPAVVYGKDMEAMNVQVPAKDFEKALKVAGESTLVYLMVGGESYPTIIHDVARDAVRGETLHADFYKVNLKEKIKAMVPVVFVGESPAVKESQGIFVRNVNELEVEALPTDLPHELTVDISSLKAFGDQIAAKDIKLPQGVELMAGADEIIATVQEPISEEELEAQLAEPTTDITAVGDVEKPVEEEVPAEEGETPAPAEAPAKEEKAE